MNKNSQTPQTQGKTTNNNNNQNKRTAEIFYQKLAKLIYDHYRL